jgi:murein DD-endopeptidase MepM/ murein hydrolase activator NlpD
LDLVGIDSKEIHSTVGGIVEYAGWENSSNHSQGFGQYVKVIDDANGYGYYFGHMSTIKVKVGQKVKVTDVLGIEGSTGNSTGSHCHYCIRKNGRGTHIDVSSVSGIPNSLGTYNDGYSQGSSSAKKTKAVTLVIDGVTYSGTLTAK